MASDGQTPSPNSTTETPQTQLERFLTKKGTLLIRDSYHVGRLEGKRPSSMEFDAVFFYLAGQGSPAAKGLTVEIKVKLEQSRKASAMLDFDELESLCKSIDYIISLLTRWKTEGRENTEVIFSTTGGFSVAAYQVGNRQGALSYCGDPDTAPCLFSNVSQLSDLRSIIQKAQQLLQKT